MDCAALADDIHGKIIMESGWTGRHRLRNDLPYRPPGGRSRGRPLVGFVPDEQVAGRPPGNFIGCVFYFVAQLRLGPHFVEPLIVFAHQRLGFLDGEGETVDQVAGHLEGGAMSVAARDGQWSAENIFPRLLKVICHGFLGQGAQAAQGL